MTPWIGVDLDGTLAKFDGWQGVNHIGDPIEPMVSLVRMWLEEKIEVRIFTARVAKPVPGVHRAIEDWCLAHIGQVLPITCSKDYDMIELWDDRAVRVEMNTGRDMTDYAECSTDL